MRATRVLVPTLLTLAVALWLALRERAPDGAPAIEREHALEDAGPRALPASEPREVAVTRSAEFEALPPPPPVVEDGGERGQAPPPEVGGGWRDDLAAPGVGRARPRDEQAQARLEPSALPPTARFGAHVALSGTIAAVAAPLTDGNGAVFVFERAGARWNEAARLVAPEEAPVNGFGSALALSGDWLAVGAPGDARTAGAVLLYRRGVGGWAFADQLASPERAAGDRYGASVALSGEKLLVSRPTAEPGFTYLRDPDWRLAGPLAGAGRPAALALDGRYAVRVQPRERWRSVVVYYWSEGLWEEFDHLYPPEPTDGAPTVAMSPDRLAIAWGGELALYDLSGQFHAREVARLKLPPLSESAPPLAVAGARVFVGDLGNAASGEHAGAVLRFDAAGDEWRAAQPLYPRDGQEFDNLGASLAADGPLVIAGAPGGGYALVWELAPPAPRRPGR